MNCKKCKHLVYCDPYKMMFHKTSGEDCDGFEERRATAEKGEKG